MTGVSFHRALTNAASDGVVDRTELARLREVNQQLQAENPQSADAQVAEQVMDGLNGLTEDTNFTQPLPAYDGHAPVELEFKVTPNYSEGETVPGDTDIERIGNISQGDGLNSTDDDMHRCGPSSMLNAYLLTSGDFASAAESIGMPADQRSMTYENVHRAQEKLFDDAGIGSQGMMTGYEYQTDASGQIVSGTTTGDAADVARALGLRARPILGSTPNTINQRSSQVDQFFSDNPTGVLQVGVNLNTSSGDVSAVNGNNQNHYILIFQRDGQYYMNNTGVASNGNGDAITPISEEQMRAFTNSPATVTGLTRR